MKIRNYKIKNSGFTLLETLVALSVLILAVTGPLTLASYSIRSSGVSQNQFTAFFLAQEALEYVKNQRDNNVLSVKDWLEGMTNCRSDNGCVIDVKDNSIQTCPSQCPKLKHDASTGLYNYQVGAETNFIRKIKFSKISDYEEKISINFSWPEKFGVKSFTLEENIFNWP